MVNARPNKKHLRISVIVNILLFAVQAVIYMTPYLNRVLHYEIRGILFAIWFLSTLFLKVRLTSILKEKHLCWFAIYTLWVLLMSLIGHSARPFMVQLASIPCMAIPFVGFIAINYYNEKEQGLLFKILFLIIFINLLSNIYIGIANPQYFEIEHMEGTDAYNSNAGSTSYVATLSFLAVICLIVYMATKNVSSKLFLLVTTIITTCYLLLFNPRATTTILLAIAFLGIFIVHREPKSTKRIRSYYIQTTILILVIIAIALLPLFTFLENVDNERLSARFSDIATVLQGGSMNSLDNSSLAGRFLLGMTSVNTFLASLPNFVVGVGDDILIGEQYEVYDLIALGIGNHSQFLDTLAKYGLIGGVFFVNIIRGISKWLKKLANSESYNHYVNLLILIFFLQSILNNSFFPDLFIIIFVVYPLLLISNNRAYEIATNKC